MYHWFWLIPTCLQYPYPSHAYLKCLLSLSFFASSVGTSLADSCLASSRHLKLLKRSDVPAQTISHPIPVINGEGDAPRPCNFHINHYFWQSPYIMSFKTCSYCCRSYRMTCHIFITLRLKIIQPRWPSCGFHIWLWSTPKKKTLASHIPRMSRMVLAGIMGLDLLPISNFPASCGEFSKPIPTKHHPIPKSPNETLV